jgi:hypothetical protein
MKDLVWTLIIVWLVYKVMDLFKSNKQAFKNSSNPKQSAYSHTKTTSPKKDIKNALQNHVNKEGEYVDFEEIK